MGRGIRRVIPNWEHPQIEESDYRTGTQKKAYQPMFDEDAQSAFDRWMEDYKEWVEKRFNEVIEDHPEYKEKYKNLGYYASFCEWQGIAPNPAFYRPTWKEEEATWYQVYETVSEGTPVTPPFETQDQLIHYLTTKGTFWNSNPWSTEAATNFVKGNGWLRSMVMTPERGILDLTQEVI